MKPYPTYKDSGIEWIGEIPKDWEVKKLKYFDSVIMGQSPDSEDCNKDRIGISFLQGNADFSSQILSQAFGVRNLTRLQKRTIFFCQ